MSDIHRQLGAFLRSLERDQFLRFCQMIRVNPPDPHDGLGQTWDQWRDNRVIGILAAKRNNPKYYETIVLHAFPATREGQELLRYMLTVDDSDFLDFYRKVTDKHGIVLHGAARPQLTLEILDCEQLDPARWTRGLQHLGLEKAERQQTADSASVPAPETPSHWRQAIEPPSSATIAPRRWTRADVIGAISVIVMIIGIIVMIIIAAI
jgi:hypothetical protein